MSAYIFLFDLDSTISKKEILPTISERIGKEKEIQELTEATMRGEVPFKTSFLNRVNILSGLNVSEVSELVAQIPLNDAIADFIHENSDRCYVITGNLDVWIDKLMKRIGMEAHLYSSKANVKDDRISQVISVVDKEMTVRQFVQPIVVIGDGDNDAGMAKYADIAVGFGGVRDIAPSLLRNIDYAFYEDCRLAKFLNSLL